MCFVIVCGVVCKNSGIVIVKDVIKKVFGCVFVDFWLVGCIVKDVVESEYLVFDFFCGW